MWEIIPKITTPLALIAYAIGAFIYYRINKTNSDKEKLLKVPEGDQAKLITTLEDKYFLSDDNLTRSQKFELLKETLTLKSKHKTKLLYLYGFMGILLTAITVFGLYQPSYKIEESVKRDLYNGYYLGSSFSKSFFQYQTAMLNTNIWTEDEINKMKSDALLSLSDAQGYAELLELQLDMKNILLHYEPDRELTNAYSPIERRIEGNYPAEVGSAFKLGFWTYWISLRSQLIANTDSSSEFLDFYNDKIVFSINKYLKEIGIEEVKLSTENDIENILTEMNNIRMKSKEFLTNTR
ncbi:MAG: hypothetical protein OEW67_01835 [Cyclobacteriaceae bacterium]|nr:hypothetical protein [Cyclobacteriaceae bacterium]